MKKVIVAEPQVEWLKQPDGVVAFTHTFKKNDSVAVDEDGRKIIKSGTIYPANDSTAEGIVRNDIDVTDEDTIGSLVVHADVTEKKLPKAPSAEAKAKLIAGGIYFYADNGETLVTPSN